MIDIIASARDWAAGDPDPDTRAELESHIAARDEAALREVMGQTLAFGTAGMRGVVGAGSNRMNRAIVIKTTAALLSFLETLGTPHDSPLVVGYDARPTSRTFAEDVVGVCVASGRPVRYFDHVAPTPLIAFAGKHFDAAATVVITASHNPPADNGYKVYADNGAQIIPPWDTGIAAALESTGPAVLVPRQADVFSKGHEAASVIDATITNSYWKEVDAARPDPRSSELSVVYTPIHGVGGFVIEDVFARAGHSGLIPVPEQMEPDGTFPTVSFPNPEEEGALDLALGLARDVEADLIIANDPDADRLAAAVPEEDDWRLLSGNELGTLLADHVLRHWQYDESPIVASSIVSSPILDSLAKWYGAQRAVTLTGFKWIMNASLALETQQAGRFAFGYEEALGYTVGPAVRDKDGISAALCFVDLAASLNEDGATILDRLHEIWGRVGMWVSTQVSVVREGSEGKAAILAAVGRLGDNPPDSIGGHTVSDMTDYRTGAETRPHWLGNQDLIEITLGDRGRLLVRPSGTEPKLKIYVDLVQEFQGDPRELRDLALTEANEIARATEDWLSI